MILSNFYSMKKFEKFGIFYQKSRKLVNYKNKNTRIKQLWVENMILNNFHSIENFEKITSYLLNYILLYLNTVIT